LPNVIASDNDILNGTNAIYGMTSNDVDEATRERQTGGSVNQMITPELLQKTTNIQGFPTRVAGEARDKEEAVIQSVATLFHESGHILEGQDQLSFFGFIKDYNILDIQDSAWIKKNKPELFTMLNKKTAKWSMFDVLNKREAFIRSLEGQNSLKELYLTIEYLKTQGINGATMDNTVINGYTEFMVQTIAAIRSDPKLSKQFGNIKYPQDLGKALDQYVFDNPDKNMDLVFKQAISYNLFSDAKSKKMGNAIKAFELSKHINHVIKYPVAFLKGETEGLKASMDYTFEELKKKNPNIMDLNGPYRNYDRFANITTELPFLLDGFRNGIEKYDVLKNMNMHEIKYTMNILVRFAEGQIDGGEVANQLTKLLKKDVSRVSEVYSYITQFDKAFFTPDVLARHPNIKTWPAKKGYSFVAHQFFDKIYIKAGVEVGL
jgi:hypothetical protein